MAPVVCGVWCLSILDTHFDTLVFQCFRDCAVHRPALSLQESIRLNPNLAYAWHCLGQW